ncbi:hypothetical protein LX36DRAFT_247538 [Colletotrichum falcatum]|nr:hypothetical protein LX36DRAFT_247538 [Colletotrichum falcatum]
MTCTSARVARTRSRRTKKPPCSTPHLRASLRVTAHCRRRFRCTSKPVQFRCTTKVKPSRVKLPFEDTGFILAPLLLQTAAVFRRNSRWGARARQVICGGWEEEGCNGGRGPRGLLTARGSSVSVYQPSGMRPLASGWISGRNSRQARRTPA